MSARSWQSTPNGRVAVPDALRAGGRAWGIAASAVALLIGVVSMLPPRGTPGVEIADLGEVRATIGHGLAYALLAALAMLAQRQPHIAVTLAGVIGYGVLLEILQGAFGLRSFQWTDVAANALGAVAGVAATARLGRSRP
ncbi:MAG: VanZ like family [Actinomycetota bacterium]